MRPYANAKSLCISANFFVPLKNILNLYKNNSRRSKTKRCLVYLMHLFLARAKPGGIRGGGGGGGGGGELGAAQF